MLFMVNQHIQQIEAVFLYICMAHRYGQEEKFKNITLRLEDVPQMHASTIVRASPADREHYRPSTPISSSKFDDNTLNIQIRTTQLPAHNRGYSISQSPNAVSHLRQQEDEEEENLRRQLQQKEEIISQLKNIIKLSNENYSRVKPKSVYLGDRSPQRHDEELKQLRHNVKVLTIQNNALSGYIDKLKQQLAEGGLNASHREGGSFERQQEQLSTIQQLKDQNKRLRELVEEKEAMYQSKIDQFILSHKSIANECRRLQHMKQVAESENERLSLILRDLQETQRRAHHQEDRMGKTITGERTSIVKIKEQYAESIRQMRETIHIQFENMFDNFRVNLAEIDKKVNFLQRRVHRIEEQLQNIGSDFPLRSTRKSQIYIEESSELASEGSARKNNFRSVIASRLDQEGERSDEDAIRPLHQQIGRLKEIIADLEQQMSSRSDYYTFRDQQSSNMPTDREKELSNEVDRLKQEIDSLEQAYQREKSAMEDRLEEEMVLRQQKTSELHILHKKYEQSLQQMQILVASKRVSQQLSEEMSMLRRQNAESLRKVEQYKRLCLLLQQETEQNSVSFQFFTDMKRQIIEIRERMHLEQVKLAATDKQNKEILAANQQLKLKIEQSLTNTAKLIEEYQHLKQLYKDSQAEKEEVALRANYNQKVIKILQDELRAKKEIENTLLTQKKSLQRQLIGYLSLFNKLTFQQKSRKQESDELPIEQLLSKLSRLQTSFNEFHSSKRVIISKMMSESFDADLSSVKRKDRI